MYSESPWCPDTAYMESNSEVSNSDGDLIMREIDNEDKFTSEGCCHGRDRHSTRKEGQQHSLKVAGFRISNLFNKQGGSTPSAPKTAKSPFFGFQREKLNCAGTAITIIFASGFFEMSINTLAATHFLPKARFAI